MEASKAERQNAERLSICNGLSLITGAATATNPISEKEIKAVLQGAFALAYLAGLNPLRDIGVDAICEAIFDLNDKGLTRGAK
jgi:hypothetical protein